MFKKPYVVAALAGLALMSSTALLQAQETATPYTFSTGLQASFDALAEAKTSLSTKIDAAISGLTRDETQTVLATYADEVTSLRATEQTLRDEGVAEMKAAGVDVPERNDRNQQGGRQGGPDGGQGGAQNGGLDGGQSGGQGNGPDGGRPERGSQGGQPGGDRSAGGQGRPSN